MRQGGDVGTQYRSVIQFTDERQRELAATAKTTYNDSLRKAGFSPVTTEIVAQEPFYYAEDYHQQYLHKVPNGYCGLEGTGVTCAIPRTIGAAL